MKKKYLLLGAAIAAYLIYQKIKAANALTPGAAIPAASDSSAAPAAAAPSAPQVSAFDQATLFGLG